MFIIQAKDRCGFLEGSGTSKQFCVFQSFVRVVRCQLAYLDHNKNPADLMALQRSLHQKVVQLRTVAHDCFLTYLFKPSFCKK